MKKACDSLYFIFKSQRPGYCIKSALFSGCGTVDRVVAYELRAAGFESNPRQFLWHCKLLKRRQGKRDPEWPIEKSFFLSFSDFIVSIPPKRVIFSIAATTAASFSSKRIAYDVLRSRRLTTFCVASCVVVFEARGGEREQYFASVISGTDAAETCQEEKEIFSASLLLLLP